MCTCGHGADRHFLDYAGPDVAGGILSKCLNEGCPCILYIDSLLDSGVGWMPPYGSGEVEIEESHEP